MSKSYVYALNTEIPSLKGQLQQPIQTFSAKEHSDNKGRSLFLDLLFCTWGKQSHEINGADESSSIQTSMVNICSTSFTSFYVDNLRDRHSSVLSMFF